MKTTSLVGLVMVAAMNLVACPGGIGFGCAADDPEVNMNVAPLTFEPTMQTEACDGTRGVTLYLLDAQGSSIRLAVQPDVRLGESLPLTADGETGLSTMRASASADGAVKVTLTDAEYNELPGGWQSAAVTIDSVPRIAGESLSGGVHFYFVDGRTLDVAFHHALETDCPVPESN